MSNPSSVAITAQHSWEPEFIGGTTDDRATVITYVCHAAENAGIRCRNVTPEDATDLLRIRFVHARRDALQDFANQLLPALALLGVKLK